MARLEKVGLDYFSFDVDFFDDEKIEAINAEFGIKGEITAIKLLCAIYRNGYFIVWSDMVKMKLLKRLPSVNLELLDKIVQRLVKWQFFDENLFNSTEKVLTSTGIQKRYFEAIKRRNQFKNLDNFPYILINVNINSINVNINSINANISTQSKVKENKLNKNENIEVYTQVDFLQKSDVATEFSFKNFKLEFYENAENYDFEKNLEILRQKFKNSNSEIEKKEIEKAGIFLKTEKEKRKIPQKEKRKGFVKPNFEELQEFFSQKVLEKKLKWTQEKIVEKTEFFLNYYESNGWKVGKNPMKNWQSAVCGQWLNDNFTNNARNTNQSKSSSDQVRGSSDINISNILREVAENNPDYIERKSFFA